MFLFYIRDSRIANKDRGGSANQLQQKIEVIQAGRE